MISVKSQTTLDTAVNFSVKDVNGNTLNLFDILDEGKIVVTTQPAIKISVTNQCQI